MHTVAIVNQKGGVGKTTLTMNLAAVLAERSPVFVIDADPQRSASRWASLREEPTFEVHPLERPTHPLTFRAMRDRLAHPIEGSIVLIDCPPSVEDDASRIALRLADLALIPILPSPLDLWAAEAAVDLALETRTKQRNELPRIVLIPNQLRSTTLSFELPESLKGLGERVGPGISLRVAVAEAAEEGWTVSEYAPSHPADEEFRRLARFVRRELRKSTE